MAVLNEVVDIFLREYPKPTWSPHMQFPKLKDLMLKYQNPHEADSLLKVQKELDETKIIMVIFHFDHSI